MINYNNTNEWACAIYPGIKDSSLRISKFGDILGVTGIALKPNYISSNGNVYVLITKEDNTFSMVPFAHVMGLTFIPIPNDLLGKPIIIRHKNGNKLDNYIDNLEWVEDVEEWRDVIYKDIKRGCYQVSNWGRVRSLFNGRQTIMKPFDSPTGYKRIYLASDTPSHSGRKCAVHQLVATAFIPGYNQDRTQINHIDANHANNHYLNLEWVTHKENTQHAMILNINPHGDKNGRHIITEQEAVVICELLNKYHGSTNEVYNELRDKITGLTPAIISSIKYGETFVYVSDRYLTDDGRTKTERKTDIGTILDVAQCLKRNKGDVKKTRNELINVYPWITLGWIWHLKDKSVAKEITDEVFSADEFSKVKPLTEEQVVMICEYLVRFNGSQRVVYEKLKDDIEGLTIDKVRAIKEKKSWRHVSDRYFIKGCFN